MCLAICAAVSHTPTNMWVIFLFFLGLITGIVWALAKITVWGNFNPKNAIFSQQSFILDNFPLMKVGRIFTYALPPPPYRVWKIPYFFSTLPLIGGWAVLEELDWFLHSFKKIVVHFLVFLEHASPAFLFNFLVVLVYKWHCILLGIRTGLWRVGNWSLQTKVQQWGRLER